MSSPCCPRPVDTGAAWAPLYPQEAYSVARQFNLIPPVCEQAEYHMFQREKVEVQLPELFHKIGGRPPRHLPARRPRAPSHPLFLSQEWAP